jgi:cell division cycle 14
MACFVLVRLQKTAEEAWEVFREAHPYLLSYRDASYGDCSYHMTIYHCLKGLERAMLLNWYNYDTFNNPDY